MLLAVLPNNELCEVKETSLGLIGSLLLGKEASDIHLASNTLRCQAGSLCVHAWYVCGVLLVRSACAPTTAAHVLVAGGAQAEADVTLRVYAHEATGVRTELGTTTINLQQRWRERRELHDEPLPIVRQGTGHKERLAELFVSTTVLPPLERLLAPS